MWNLVYLPCMLKNNSNIRKFCSVRFSEKHLPYVQALTESQWYIATCDQLELAVTCPHRCYHKVLLPPFSMFSLPKFCMGFSAQVKLFPLEKTLGTIDQTLKIFEVHLVTRGPKADYRIFNNFSPHDHESKYLKKCAYTLMELVAFRYPWIAK